MIIIDPQTRKRIVVDKRSCDVVYDLDQGSASVKNEDVPLTGNWSDWTGSQTVNSKTQQQWAGHVNKLQGSDADIESKAKDFTRTNRGKNTQTFRTRQRRVYKKL